MIFSVWLPGWDIFSNDATGKFFFETSELKKLLNKKRTEKKK